MVYWYRFWRTSRWRDLGFLWNDVDSVGDSGEQGKVSRLERLRWYFLRRDVRIALQFAWVALGTITGHFFIHP